VLVVSAVYSEPADGHDASGVVPALMRMMRRIVPSASPDLRAWAERRDPQQVGLFGFLRPTVSSSTMAAVFPSRRARGTRFWSRDCPQDHEDSVGSGSELMSPVVGGSLEHSDFDQTGVPRWAPAAAAAHTSTSTIYYRCVAWTARTKVGMWVR
jgi:hypothetical protein